MRLFFNVSAKLALILYELAQSYIDVDLMASAKRTEKERKRNQNKMPVL